ncbi:MAG: hypothetical protein AAGG56_16740 [Pseudomonadota bacterium]
MASTFSAVGWLGLWDGHIPLGHAGAVKPKWFAFLVLSGPTDTRADNPATGMREIRLKLDIAERQALILGRLLRWGGGDTR